MEWQRLSAVDEIAEATRFHGLILLKLRGRSDLMFTLLRRKDIRLAQGITALGSEPEKPLKIHRLRESLG